MLPLLWRVAICEGCCYNREDRPATVHVLRDRGSTCVRFSLETATSSAQPPRQRMSAQFRGQGWRRMAT